MVLFFTFPLSSSSLIRQVSQYSLTFQFRLSLLLGDGGACCSLSPERLSESGDPSSQRSLVLLVAPDEVGVSRLFLHLHFVDDRVTDLGNKFGVVPFQNGVCRVPEWGGLEWREIVNY